MPYSARYNFSTAAISEKEQVKTLRSLVKYIDNDLLATSIIEATTTDQAELELILLTYVAHTVNRLRITHTEDGDLQNIHLLSANLPLPFAWESKRERDNWTLSLAETLPIMNTEIGDHYKLPEKITDRSGVFRFFLLDWYARWVATNAEPERNLDRDRDISNCIVNAICEAAVVLAEQGRLAAVELVVWMNSQKWIEKDWGFTPELIDRAHVFKVEE